MKPTHKKVYTMDIKMAQRVLLAHRQCMDEPLTQRRKSYNIGAKAKQY